MNTKIAILFGPKGGNTEKAANLIAKKLGAQSCDLIPVRDAHPEELEKYSKFIIGSSTIGTHTWSHKNSSPDWDQFLPKLRKMNFTGKKVALFGLGDHLAYANHFVDDMFTLYKIVTDNGAVVVGHCSTDGYEFNESAAVINGKFVGLPIDDDHEDEMTETRIDDWLNSLTTQL